MLKIKWISTSLLFGMGLWACGGKDNVGIITDPNSNTLIGKWYFKTMKTTGYYKAPPLADSTSLDSMATFTDTTYYIDLRADSTYIYKAPPGKVPLIPSSSEGKFAVVGNLIIVTDTVAKISLPITYSISNGIMNTKSVVDTAGTFVYQGFPINFKIKRTEESTLKKN